MQYRRETTDPQDEIFDVLTQDGELTGERAARWLVHQNGLWHPAFHLWIAWATPEGLRVLLQRRSLTKDTMPGRVDVSVGGHFKAGEFVPGQPLAPLMLAAIVREVNEELGFRLEPSVIQWLGTRWSEAVQANICDREVQYLYFWLRDGPLVAIEPDPREVAALLAVSVRGLLELLEQERMSVEAPVLWSSESGAGSTRSVQAVTFADLVPGRQRYWRVVLHLLEQNAAKGEVPTEPLVLHEESEADAG
ncbi:MAG: NUDIX domain-containing protein [Thermomicrobium sp.]|uniref:NUDIX hydrolase n=1 Tax=Thermomicrobium sp. TaxID=1969469 RepID=UPI001B15EF09|nr:NUDIX domain-containing protein [Thermomicrobium sp.]MBO9351416.1 NUDIX domain-containing protein [Thermomicrobium sp.]